NEALTAHRACAGPLILRLPRLFPGIFQRDAGDRQVQRDDGVDRACEGQLDRATDLPAIVALPLLPAEDGAKSPNIEEVCTHPGACLVVLVVRTFLKTDRLEGALLVVHQVAAVFDVNLTGRLRAVHPVHPVTHLALEADIGHEAVHGFRIDAGQVASV